jgi:hypothetical protein
MLWLLISTTSLDAGSRGTVEFIGEFPPYQPAWINLSPEQIVALGVIVDVRAARWNTPNGSLPAEYRRDWSRALDNGFFLSKPVSFQVEEYWKNPQAEDTLQVLSLGGNDGSREVRYNNAFTNPRVGSRWVLFATKETRWHTSDPVWRESGLSFQIVDGKVNVTPCLQGQGPCEGTPLAQVRADMLDALATGKQYEIPQPAQAAVATP